tara:strand:+ start:129 stop:260 length:132 start_codon:yes stop_codon:yes gene_type:complete
LIIIGLNVIKLELWDTQKSIEEEEKSALRKEELEKETKKDSYI